MEKQTSLNNCRIIKDYDQDMIIQTIEKANRIKHLSLLIKLNIRFKNKPWKEYVERDIKTFIAEIMQQYSSKGDKTV